MPLLLVFIIVPIIEIALFIQVGGLLGLWPTLGCVVLTAIIGTALLRHQGLQVLRQAQTSMEDNRLPVEPVMHGAFLLVAGLLLLTPGFFTDAVGFALLVPPVRLFAGRYIWQRLKGKVQVFTPGAPPRGRPGGDNGRGIVIEGEAVEVETETRPEEPEDAPSDVRNPESPWRKGL